MINKEEIHLVQKKWGDAIVEIGRLKGHKDSCEAKTSSMLSELYGFDYGDVLFKPTKASEKQFRLKLDAAKSYFIGGDDNFFEDSGFALNPWVNVRFENVGYNISEKVAVAMGNYFFTSPDGNETKVEYTFGYFKDRSGSLKINLHHSSLPFVNV